MTKKKEATMTKKKEATTTKKETSNQEQHSVTTHHPGDEVELHYVPVSDVNPLKLIGNAHLALHHHMAPADGGFDLENLETDEDEG